MECNFCGREIPKGTGNAFVHTKGKISYFCSSRCYKNGILLHRKFNKKEAKERVKVQKRSG